MKDIDHYRKSSEEVYKTKKLRRMMKDLAVVTREEKEDHLQDIILLTLRLMKKYSFNEEEITGKQFLALLRRAFERDLIDRLERRCKTVVWGAFGEKKKVNSKIVSVKEFDTEYEYKELNDRDGRVVLPAVILDPESEYLIFHILGRMKVTFSDHWEILRDLLANEGLCEYDSASLPHTFSLGRTSFGSRPRWCVTPTELRNGSERTFCVR